MADEVLIRVEQVQKKFCRSLRKSLRYGLEDIAADLLGRRHSVGGLRLGEFYALNDVSFDLKRGECLGVIGRNGAGKTTLLKMLNGLIKPDGGQVTVRGRVGALIALGAGFNPLLSGRENIYVNASILGMRRAEIEAKLESIIDYAEIREFIDAPVQSYSSGMIVRLGFAVAIHCELDSLLLDEVLAVGDSAFQAKCFNTLGEFRRRGIGFILVSHNLSAIDCFSDRVVYLKKGRLVYAGETRRGIAEFNRDMLSEGESAPAELEDESRVCGNGKVLLRRISFLDGAGMETREIQAGDPMTLRLEYEVGDPIPKPTLVDIHIKDQGGVFFQDMRAVNCPALKGRGRIDVAFASIPANNQRLLFSICLTSGDGMEIYDWKSNVPLTVQGSARYRGRIYLSFESQVMEEERREKLVVQ